jgi:hypothetical protein
MPAAGASMSATAKNSYLINEVGFFQSGNFESAANIP